MKPNVTRIYDAIVVGGGVAGSVCATMLAKSGASVALVESRPSPAWRIGETLAAESRGILQALGVWTEFCNQGHLSCPGILSSWGGSVLERSAMFNPHGCDWQVDRAKFEELLLGNALASGVWLQQGCTFLNAGRTNETWQVDLDSGQLRGRWLIDSTGRRSGVARRMGAHRENLDDLVSLFVTVTASRAGDADSRTLIESSPTGWWYSALTPGSKRTVAYQTGAEQLRDEAWRNSEWLGQQILETVHLATTLGRHRYGFDAPPRLTSAHSGRLSQFCGEGWLAVGDAALSFDPLSGKGMLEAMRSGTHAAETVLQSSVRLDAYAESLECAWMDYIKARSNYYSFERRWKKSPFWISRSLSAT